MHTHITVHMIHKLENIARNQLLIRVCCQLSLCIVFQVFNSVHKCILATFFVINVSDIESHAAFENIRFAKSKFSMDALNVFLFFMKTKVRERGFEF